MKAEKRHSDARGHWDCLRWPDRCSGDCGSRTDFSSLHQLRDGEVIVTIDKQGLIIGLKQLGVEPGSLFLAHRQVNGTVVLEPCRIERLT